MSFSLIQHHQIEDYAVKKEGDVMTGFLTLSGNPTDALHAVPKQYLEDNFVSIAGDIMTGFLTLSANPTDPLHAATKQYIDQNFYGSTADATHRVYVSTTEPVNANQGDLWFQI